MLKVVSKTHINAGLYECLGHLHHELVEVRMEAIQTAIDCHGHLRLVDTIHQNCNTCAMN